MTEQETFQMAPPRNLTIPQVPTPQTVSGILCDSGLPSDPENITDIAPDFGWMSAIEEWLTTFKISQDTTGQVVDIFPQKKFPDIPFPTIINLNHPTWHWLPFGCSKWWSGVCRLRFMAIKPPRVPCKLLIRYMPDVAAFSNDHGFLEDTLRRGIKVEWDLAMNQECSIDIGGYNWTTLRPTWIPRFASSDARPTANDLNKFKNWIPHLSQISLGVIRVEVANQMVPGNIFPDEIRILVFQSFPGAQFYSATDPRSMKYHFFFLGQPWPVNEKTIYPD